MKKDWETKKLGELCSFIGDGDWIESGDQSTEGIRLVQTGNVGEGIYLDKENRAHYISEETFTRLKCTEIFPGDCLISRLPEPVGRACIIPDLNQKMITAVDCTIIRFKENIQPQYFVYYSQSNKYLSDIDSEATGATRKRISRKNLEKISIPVPPLEEQKRIVKILDEKFAQLETIKANAQTNLQNAKDLFQSQLTKVFSNTTWQKKRLDEVCAITSKLVDPTLPEYLDLYHVGGANIESETGVLLDLKTSKEEGLSSGKFTFDESMVLYNKIRPYLKKVARPDFAGLCSADMYPLNPKDNITKDYLYYILTSDDFTKYAISKSDRAGMPKVNREALFAYECYLPPLPEQKHIVEELDTLSEKVRQLQEIYTKQIANCDELKQSLLQKAFEGEL